VILQALNEYYERKIADPDPALRLPAFGWQEKDIPFIFELTRDGKLATITDTRQMVGKQRRAASFLVPASVKKTSGVAANLLWDTVEYALGLADSDKAGEAKAGGDFDAYLSRVHEKHAAFATRIGELPPAAQSDVGLWALTSFLASNIADAVSTMSALPEISSANPVVSFRLVGDVDLICQRPAVFSAVLELSGVVQESVEATDVSLPCLVTGKIGVPERLHASIKGVWGAQTSGANIVSFNLDAFRSYGKDQGSNSPIGRRAAFAYTTALNHLLRRDSRQRIQVGDASTVFWAQREQNLFGEDWLSTVFGELDNPDRTEQVRALLDSVRAGKFDSSELSSRFYVLGLAPNAARIAVRFWHSAPLGEIATRIREWFDDLKIVRGPNDPEFPSLFRLLSSVAVMGKSENIPPSIAGDVMRSILTGGSFPFAWLSAAVRRCRAEQAVGYCRASVIKACLVRTAKRFNGVQSGSGEEITEMLDPSNPSTAYRLGRLFAVLEKAQEEASPGLNATIRDRYYGAASATPVAVFTTLLRLKNHHISKLENKGRAVNLEKQIGDIASGIDAFPAHLNLQDQGRFALGYYHQRQAFFSRQDADKTNEKEGTQQ
jgi:CRISPR-associated protein Csd1